MLGTLLASIPMTYVGALFDRRGGRRTLSVVVLLFGLACLGMSRVTGLVTIFLAFLFLRMCGQGAMELIATNTDAMWFHRRLGTATGIKRVVGSLMFGTIPPLHIWLIYRFGWRAAYVILGISVWAIMAFILLALFRDRPESIGLLPDGDTLKTDGSGTPAAIVDDLSFSPGQTFRTRAYWIMASAGSLWSMIGTGVQFNMQPISIEHGFTSQNAATWFLFLAVSSSITFLAGGILADRVRPNFLLPVSFIAMVCGLLLLIHFGSLAIGYLSAIAFGIGHSIFFTMRATLYVRYYGRVHIGKIIGVIATISVASSALGPFAMGFLKDQFSTYGVSLWVFLAIAAPMIFLSFLAAKPKHPDAK